jgi:hypothetical protein
MVQEVRDLPDDKYIYITYWRKLIMENFVWQWWYVVPGLVLWIILAILAINIVLGRDALFIYEAVVIPALGPVWGPIIFHVLWLLWPLGILILYLVVWYCAIKGDKE